MYHVKLQISIPIAKPGKIHEEWLQNKFWTSCFPADNIAFSFTLYSTIPDSLKTWKAITIFFFNLLHDSTLALNIKQECICLSKFRHNDKIKIQEGERV